MVRLPARCPLRRSLQWREAKRGAMLIRCSTDSIAVRKADGGIDKRAGRSGCAALLQCCCSYRLFILLGLKLLLPLELLRLQEVCSCGAEMVTLAEKVDVR